MRESPNVRERKVQVEPEFFSNVRERNMVDCCVMFVRNLDFQSWKKTRTNPEDWLLQTSL